MQIDIMCADTAITVYPKFDKVKDRKGRERKFERASTQSLQEARAKWNDNIDIDPSRFKFG